VLLLVYRNAKRQPPEQQVFVPATPQWDFDRSLKRIRRRFGERRELRSCDWIRSASLELV
jgi:hypothetical protein